MEAAMRELDLAFKDLSRIYVSGDDVDRMSSARERLRRAYASLGQLVEEQRQATNVEVVEDKEGNHNE